MADLYTKAVLTIIALTLATLAIENFMTQSDAQQRRCGEAMNDPCYVATGMNPLQVRISP